MFLTKPSEPGEPEPRLYPDKVQEWRLEVLLRAGYDLPGAKLLARRREVDLHVAVSLLEQGCPVNTAMAILL
jgi:hypothetical protein